jgi:hypothetical protein
LDERLILDISPDSVHSFETADSSLKNQLISASDYINRISSTQELGDMEKLPNSLHNDIGLELYKQSLEIDPAKRDAIAKHIKMKLDCILMSLVSFCFLS